MPTYPFTPSELGSASAEQLLAFIKSPTLLARRFADIMKAQSFMGLFLLSGRYTIQGGAIAVPVNETIRTDRASETVNPGAEYKLTSMSPEQYEFYASQKDGLAHEVTDEEVGRSLRQPIDDGIQRLSNELVVSSSEGAVGVIQSSVTTTLAAGAAWTTGKQILKDAVRVRSEVRNRRLGYTVDTAVLPTEMYADAVGELSDLMDRGDSNIVNGDFPGLGGITWIEDETGDLTDPLFIDRTLLGGIAREQIPSPEYKPVGGDTGVEVASIRIPTADKTRIQARNPHVPVVVNPLAGVRLTGAA